MFKKIFICVLALMLMSGLVEAEIRIDGGKVDNFKRILLKQENNPTRPTIAFGDGNTGIIESTNNALTFVSGGSSRWTLNQTAIADIISTRGVSLLQETSSATNPVYTFDGDQTTGIGSAGAGVMNFINTSVATIRTQYDGSNADIRLFGEIVYLPQADQTVGNNGTISLDSSMITRIAGDGGAVTLAVDSCIDTGVADGQVLILQGTNNTNTVTINDNVGIQLNGAVTLGLNDTLTIMWDSGEGDWMELSRSDNN
jgi:hypothetical protein